MSKQIWIINAGNTWETEIMKWYMDYFKACKKKNNSVEVKITHERKQKIDLIIKTYPDLIDWNDINDKINPERIFIFELKFTDLHSSLFPKASIDKKKTTSLAEELGNEYVPYNADFKFLIYVHFGLTEMELCKLDSIMYRFPDIRRKSFNSQISAIESIYKLVKLDIPPLNLAKPPYISVGDFGIARALANSHNAFSMEFAQVIVESREISSFKDIVEKLDKDTLLVESQWFYPTDKFKLIDEINYKIHGGIKPKSLIKKEEKKKNNFKSFDFKTTYTIKKRKKNV